MDSSPVDAPSRRRWLTWANGLTALRAAAAPALVVALIDGAAGTALLLFSLAVATDLADGRVARRLGEASALGGFLDHVVDAGFVVAGLAGLVALGLVPVVLPVLVLAAFLQYTLDSRAHTGLPLRASFLGRWNGIGYFVPIGVVVIRDGLGLGWPPDSWVLMIAWGLVATTLASMVDRAVAPLRIRGSG